MEHFETNMNHFSLQIRYYYIYSNDALILYRHETQLDLLLDKLKNIHPRIPLTTEYEYEGTINFVDLQIYYLNTETIQQKHRNKILIKQYQTNAELG